MLKSDGLTEFLPFSSQQLRMHILELMAVLVPLVFYGTIMEKYSSSSLLPLSCALEVVYSSVQTSSCSGYLASAHIQLTVI